MVFLLFMLDDRRIRIPTPRLVLMDQDPGGPKTYESYESRSTTLRSRYLEVSPAAAPDEQRVTGESAASTPVDKRHTT